MKAEELTKVKKPSSLKRRDFVKLLGGGIFIFVRPWNLDMLSVAPADQGRSLPKDYNAFLQIAEDGTVTCYTGKIEMGQGVVTSLVQMMADELNVPMEKVNIVMGDTGLCPWDAGTWGSLSTRVFGPSMRAAAAEARGVLTDLASKQLNVPPERLEVKDGIISDTQNPGATVSYGQLARGQKIDRYLEIKPTPEDFTKFTFVGKGYKRADSMQKVTGEAKYAGDLKLQRMVYARILRPPTHIARVTSADWSEAEKVEGTTVIQDKDLIAVLNENRDRADEAIAKIKAEYASDEPQVNDSNIHEWLVKNSKAEEVVRKNGNPDEGIKLSGKVYESEFTAPYLAHMPIETHTALASWENGKITVWASTQSPFGLQDNISRELNLPPEKVRVITPFVGGGFGGKSQYIQGVEAARLARLADRPVMVTWTRDEEFLYDNYHPASVTRVKSGMDSSGMIKYWDYRIYGGGTRGSEFIYDIPNAITVQYSAANDPNTGHPFSTGPWRAPNAQDNAFAREVQIDIMAADAGTDPMEFRIKNLKDDKMISCLKAVSDLFGYRPSKSPSGRGVGLAVGTDAGTWVAMIAEVKVDKSTGKVNVIRVACAQDMGLCVNPQGAALQMEGCITMGMGYTFSEELQFEGSGMKNRNFDSYQIPRFSRVPEIETVILDRKDQPPKGGGEPAIITVGAAVANAIYDATGARLYSFPMTPERVFRAISKV
jgi:isoquinoline 1-oxidoreductase